MRSKAVRIKVLMFAILRDLAGEGQTTLELEEGATVRDALARLGEKYPRVAPALGRVAVAVNQAYAKGEAVLSEGDELALIPPVSGG
jgi:MoaE-MoaD fusion protein